MHMVKQALRKTAAPRSLGLVVKLLLVTAVLCVAEARSISHEPFNSLQQQQVDALKAYLPAVVLADDRESWVEQLLDPAQLSLWLAPHRTTAIRSTAIPGSKASKITIKVARVNGEVVVTQISIEGAGLNLAALTDLVSALPALQSFSASNCQQYTTSRQVDTASNLPAKLAQLSPASFVSLTLANCGVQGNLPEQWGSWSSIQHLDLADNKITGSLPSSWQQMSSLSTLSLENNNLRGPLPASWGTGAIPNNVVMNVCSNPQLVGNIPQTWARFSGLVSVEGTSIAGCVPEALTDKVVMSADVLVQPCSEGITSDSNDQDVQQAALLRIRALVGEQLLPSWVEERKAAGPMSALGPSYCSAFTGVTCDSNGNIIKLDFSSANRSQQTIDSLNTNLLMVQVKRLKYLQTLIAPKMKLSGGLPFNLAAHVTDLRHIDVSGNPGIHGVLPRWWAGLTRLEYLDVSGTNIRGQTPRNWASMQHLKVFKASNSNIVRLSSAWGLISSLKEVEVSNAQLRKELPAAWGDPLAMQTLALRELQDARQAAAQAAANQTAAKAAMEAAATAAASLPADTRIQMASANAQLQEQQQRVSAAVEQYRDAQETAVAAANALSSLEAALGQIVDSSAVDAGMMRASQQSASAQLGLMNLEVLRLGGNNISGSLPDSFANLSKLKVLDLQANSLTGALPGSWGALAGMQELLLGGNSKLNGTVPIFWSRLSNLVNFDINRNQLTGNLPSGFVSMRDAVSLDFSSNNFKGALPREWQYMTGEGYKLRCLVLSANPRLGDLSKDKALLELKAEAAGRKLRVVIAGDKPGFCDTASGP